MEAPADFNSFKKQPLDAAGGLRVDGPLGEVAEEVAGEVPEDEAALFSLLEVVRLVRSGGGPGLVGRCGQLVAG